jgi:hypothetical protein
MTPKKTCFLQYRDFKLTCCVETDVNVPTVSNRPKKIFKKHSVFVIGPGSGSVIIVYGFEDPDPFQNVTVPEHLNFVLNQMIDACFRRTTSGPANSVSVQTGAFWTL